MPIDPAAARSAGLDTLRAAAITLTFAYHYMVFVSGEATFGWLSVVGWTGVDLFFVLSGYLIADQIFRGLAQGRRLSMPAFYARRALRTFPNYFVVLALFFLFPAFMGGAEPPPLWRFVTFTQNIQLRPGTAFSHAWSLCVEEQFYLVLPIAAVLLLGRRRRVRLAWALLLALLLGGIAMRSMLWLEHGRIADGGIRGYHPNIYYATLCRFDEFLPGIAIALLKHFHPRAWAKIRPHGRALCLAGSAAVAAVLFAVHRWYWIEGYGYGYAMTGFGYSLVAIAFALLLLSALCEHSPLCRWRVPGAAALAAWSYAIYLVHKPIGMILARELRGSALPEAALVALTVAASLLGGWLLYRCVERPFMRLRERRFPSSFPARLGEDGGRSTPAPHPSTETGSLR